MKKQIFITAVILGALVAAVVLPTRNAIAKRMDDIVIRASSFQYNESMPAVHGQRLVYDPASPALRGAGFGY